MRKDIVNRGSGPQPSVANEKPPAAIDTETLYLKWKWRTDVSDHATGLSNAALKEGVLKLVTERPADEPWIITRARLFAYLADNMAVGFSKFDCFPAIASWNRWDRPLTKVLKNREKEVDAKYAPWLPEAVHKGWRDGSWRLWKDFDHSAPDWEKILKLGFSGMKARVDGYVADTPFYKAEKVIAVSMMRMLSRIVAVAEGHPDASSPLMAKEIASLKRLCEGPPQTVFDVMEFTLMYFIFSEHIDRYQVRTLGNIDRLWWPYYKADLAAGRTTEAAFREEFRHFIWQFGSIDNYWGHPMYLGGTKADGATEYNPLSEIILDVVDREALPTPKFQLKVALNTPDAIWRKALEMLRRHRPLVLVSERGMAQSMKPMGFSDDECRNLLLWGCYEYLPAGRGNCTSGYELNLAKIVEKMLAEAATEDSHHHWFATFESFKAEYLRRLVVATDRLRELTTESERHLAEINPSMVLSLAIDSALEKGADAFSTGMTYNFTAIAEIGFATTVDALMAVKEIVYERREMSLASLGTLMAANWKGREDLRRRMQRSKRKWGVGNREVDALGVEVLESFTSRIVGWSNGRGGKYVCYGLHALGYVVVGRLTGATPDGRMAGDELSKNMSPAVGADSEGITALLNTYATVRPEFFPCGSVLDVMLHSSSVAGEKGLAAFRSLVKVWMANGGTALNVNVQSVDELKDAQLHPERYENLQVRVAGWNIRWNDIPRREQDEFIRRLETIP